MANVYSSSRPLTGQGPQTSQHEEMAEYAYSQVHKTLDLAVCTCAVQFVAGALGSSP